MFENQVQRDDRALDDMPEKKASQRPGDERP